MVSNLSRSFIPISLSSRPTRSSCVWPASHFPREILTAIAFKLTDAEVTDFYARSKGSPIPGVPNFDARRVVDGQRKITVLKQLPTTSAGRKFELRNKVVGVYDKGKASVLETEQAVVDVQSGDVYCTVNSSAFYVGQGGWGGPKG